MLISIEGIDGSGKSTLIRDLEVELADLDPVVTREPGVTWVGDAVRRGIAEEIDPIAEALLFVADHAAHLAAVIRPSLAAGRVVVSDRYSDSRYAYQAVTLAGCLPDPVGWLRRVHEGWTIRPDRTYLLVIPVEDALRRLEASAHREHFEQADILERVQQHYLAFAAEDPERFVIVDAMKEKEEIVSFVAGDIRRHAGWSRSRPRRS
ncbi:MAG TPA: dTMP kinase [Methanoculleus sp.]|nr:dTMP kinase [Methanoculleus sp.]